MAIFLAKNYVLLVWGAYEIKAQTLKNSPVEHSVGRGINDLQNFYLFSCNPNTHGFVEGRHRVAYATRSIKAGEQVSAIQPKFVNILSVYSI